MPKVRRVANLKRSGFILILPKIDERNNQSKGGEK